MMQPPSFIEPIVPAPESAGASPATSAGGGAGSVGVVTVPPHWMPIFQKVEALAHQSPTWLEKINLWLEEQMAHAIEGEVITIDAEGM